MRRCRWSPAVTSGGSGAPWATRAEPLPQRNGLIAAGHHKVGMLMTRLALFLSQVCANLLVATIAHIPRVITPFQNMSLHLISPLLTGFVAPVDPNA